MPEDLRPYYKMCIEKCPVNKSEIGKVCYLTVHESYQDEENAQRREGLHIEAPGVNSLTSSFKTGMYKFMHLCM